MKTLTLIPKKLLILLVLLTFNPLTETEAQTKKIKRPKSRVGISSVDTFVRESFDLYDKVYRYDGYAEAGTPLDDDDIDVLEEALTEMTALSESAPDILSDLNGVGVLKQGKATLQINKAKKALKYSIKTAKELLLGQRERETKEPDSSPENDQTDDTQGEQTTKPSTEDTQVEDKNFSDDLKINRKFDFVPGDKLLFFDDFSQDFVGDFPSKWNTNGSGEVVTFNDGEKWFKISGGYNSYTLPLIEGNYPEEFTIEFDLALSGVDAKTSSNSRLKLTLDDNPDFNNGANYGFVRIPLAQYIAIGIDIRSFKNRKSIIQNAVNADVRAAVLNKPHISIAVNKERFRLWVNQTKYVDIPKFLVANSVKGFKVSVESLKNEKEALYISNVKIAEGGVDLRRKLMAEGKISTNGILFDSGSDKIQAQSYGIIRQISQVLQQDPSIRLNIIGHTDADGPEDANLKLSKARALAVKNALTTIYNISEDRLQTDGKGETVPVGDNATSDGKAQNRRVEFVKI